jgi:hypothetical protein
MHDIFAGLDKVRDLAAHLPFSFSLFRLPRLRFMKSVLPSAQRNHRPSTVFVKNEFMKAHLEKGSGSS